MTSRVKRLSILVLGTSLLMAGSMLQAADSPVIKPAKFGFIRLYVKDPDQSIAFYAKVLGLHEIRRLSAPTVPATEVFLGSDDPNATLIDLEERNSHSVLVTAEPNAGSAVLCLTTETLTASTNAAPAAGGRIVMPEISVAWHNMAFTVSVIDDPDGNHIELLQNQPLPPTNKSE